MSSPYTAFQAPSAQAQGSQPATNPYGAYQTAAPPSAPDEPQGSAFMRFIKAAGSKIIAGTLNAGPTMQSDASPEKLSNLQQVEAEAQAAYKSGRPISSAFSSPSATEAAVNTFNQAKELNPISVEKFRQGDIAGGAGDTLANLLMIRGALKAKGLPEGGVRPFNTSEIVQPISGYTKLTPEQVAAERVPPSVWQGEPPAGYEEAPQLSQTPIQDALADKGLTQPSAGNVKLGPGAEGLMGITRSITKDGQPLGHITYEVKGNTATVHHLGGPEADYDAFSNALGRQGLRQVANQLQEAHPELENIQGIRVGGARGDAGRSVSIPLKKQGLSTTPIQDALAKPTAEEIIQQYTSTPNKSTGPAQWRRFMAQKAAEQASK